MIEKLKEIEKRKKTLAENKEFLKNNEVKFEGDYSIFVVEINGLKTRRYYEKTKVSLKEVEKEIKKTLRENEKLEKAVSGKLTELFNQIGIEIEARKDQYETALKLYSKNTGERLSPDFYENGTAILEKLIQIKEFNLIPERIEFSTVYFKLIESPYERKEGQRAEVKSQSIHTLTTTEDDHFKKLEKYLLEKERQEYMLRKNLELLENDETIRIASYRIVYYKEKDKEVIVLSKLLLDDYLMKHENAKENMIKRYHNDMLRKEQEEKKEKKEVLLAKEIEEKINEIKYFRTKTINQSYGQSLIKVYYKNILIDEITSFSTSQKIKNLNLALEEIKKFNGGK